MRVDSSIIIGAILDPDGVRKGVNKAEKELKKLKDVEIRADIKQSKVEGSEKAVNNLLEERKRILARIAQKETEKFNKEQATRKVNQEKLAVDKKTLESKIRQNRIDRIALTAGVKEKKGIAEKSNLAADRTNLANTEKQLRNVKNEAIELKNELKKVKIDLENISAVELAKTTGLADKIKMEQTEGTRVVDRRIVGAKNTFEKDKLDLIKVNEELDKARIKAQKLQGSAGKINFDKVKKSASGILGGLSNIIKKVGLWAGAMFGVRSIYLGIRKLISTISGMNAQVKTDLEYITFAIAKEFEGIVIQIIQWIYKLMGYIKYIAKAWFGINLFANATTDAFKKQENAVGGTVDKVKELKRQLAGFDEMNRLNKGLDDIGGGGGGGGPSLDPSFDLSNFETDIPWWVDWIADNKDTVFNWAKALLGILAGFKILQWVSNIGKIIKGLKETKEELGGVFKNMTLLKGLGIAVAISGIVIAIKKLIDIAPKLWKIAEGGDVDMSAWTDWLGVIKGVGIAIIGLGIAASNPLVALAGLGVVIAGLAGDAAYASTEAGRLERANDELREATDELVDAKWKVYDAENALNKAVDDQIDAVKRERESLKRLQEAEKESGLSGKKLQDQVDSGAKSVMDLSNKELNLLGLYRDHEKANENIAKSTEIVTTATGDLEVAIKLLDDATRHQELTMFKQAAQTLKSKEEFDKFKESVVEAFGEGKLNGEEAAEAIATAMSVMGSDSKTAIESLPKAIRDNLTEEKLKKNNKEVIGWGENLWRNLKNIFSGGIKFDILGQFSTGGGLGSGGGSGGSRNAKGAVYLPRFKSGGIINYPNKGVNLGGRAIGGESGAEGVIPLTDSQMMARLGKAIGENIVLNATLNTILNARTINRETRRVELGDNFATNGGYR